MVRYAALLLILSTALFGQSVITNFSVSPYSTFNVPNGWCAIYPSDWVNMTTSSPSDNANMFYVANFFDMWYSCLNNGPTPVVSRMAALRFNTSSISGTIVSATLYLYPQYKYTQYTPYTTRGMYVRKTGNTIPVAASDIPTSFYGDPSTNKIGSIAMSSITAGAWFSVSISSPDSSVNKGGNTVWLLFFADPNATITTQTTAYYGIYLSAYGSGQQPYLVLTMAGGARLIIVSDSD